MTVSPLASFARQAVAYGAAGLLNTALGVGVVVALTRCTQAGPVISNAAGVGTGLVASFVMHRRIFNGRRNAGEAARWGLAVLAAFMTDMALLRLCLTLFAGWSFATFVSQGLALASYSLTLFLLSRYWVFKPPSASAPGPGVRAAR